MLITLAYLAYCMCLKNTGNLIAAITEWREVVYVPNSDQSSTVSDVADARDDCDLISGKRTTLVWYV